MPHFDPDDITRQLPSWWDSVGDEGPKPYATKSWTYRQTVIEEEGSCEPDQFDDQDDLDCEVDPLWWESIGDEGPKPYSAAAWTYTQVLVEEDEDLNDRPDPILNLATGPVEWWELIGDEGPKPYATAAWTYHQDVTFVLEFVPISLKLFFVFDEEYYPRTQGLGVILDSGYFGQVGEAIYESGYYLGGERGIFMKRKLARVFVYDQLATSPGILPLIPQSLGILSTDPSADKIVGNGDLQDVQIEAARASNSGDDVPPGTLLGSVSYELFGNTVTITDWEHLNWQDDTPVYKAVKVILNELPDCVTEIKVLDPPHAFWTSLGFLPDFKGDQYLHLHTA
jgi:hypothetical protein